MDGILQSFRKDIGLDQKEFRESSFYEEAYNIAQTVTERDNRCKILQLFQISEMFHNI